MDYKEKLEEAKRLYELANDDQKHVLETLFPELSKLRESEYERIRKNLISCISTFKHPLFSEIERKEFLAWLENQCQVKETVISQNEDEQIRKGLIQYFSTFTLDTFAGLEPKKILSWLEKQGEQIDNLTPQEAMDIAVAK